MTQQNRNFIGILLGALIIVLSAGLIVTAIGQSSQLARSDIHLLLQRDVAQELDATKVTQETNYVDVQGKSIPHELHGYQAEYLSEYQFKLVVNRFVRSYSDVNFATYWNKERNGVLQAQAIMKDEDNAWLLTFTTDGGEYFNVGVADVRSIVGN